MNDCRGRQCKPAADVVSGNSFVCPWEENLCIPLRSWIIRPILLNHLFEQGFTPHPQTPHPLHYLCPSLLGSLVVVAYGSTPCLPRLPWVVGRSGVEAGWLVCGRSSSACDSGSCPGRLIDNVPLDAPSQGWFKKVPGVPMMALSRGKALSECKLGKEQGKLRGALKLAAAKPSSSGIRSSSGDHEPTVNSQ